MLQNKNKIWTKTESKQKLQVVFGMGSGKTFVKTAVEIEEFENYN